MGTLLLRLTAPLQAWGDESKYDIRGTRNEPTKSGVIGMIAAALGYRRDSEKIGELATKLRMGIRVDQQGTIVRDFQTARAPKYGSGRSLRYKMDGSLIMEDAPYVTFRYYLCDACFLVGMECNDMDYLHTIEEALKTPIFHLYLGRKSCPPALPVVLGVENNSLENVLRETGWMASTWYKNRQKCIRARIIIETEKEQTAWYTQMDQPVSYSPIQRKYTLRGLNKEQYVLLGIPEHDPMINLQEE